MFVTYLAVGEGLADIHIDGVERHALRLVDGDGPGPDERQLDAPGGAHALELVREARREHDLQLGTARLVDGIMQSACRQL